MNKEIIEQLVIEYWMKIHDTEGKHETEIRSDKLMYQHWLEALKRIKEKGNEEGVQ